MDTVSFGGYENILNFMVMAAQLVNILKIIVSYTLNEWIIWYMNHISIKWLSKKKEKEN